MKRVIILMAVVFALLTGCATQHLSEQTKDPVILATAVYLDALNSYNQTLSTYLPYRTVLAQSNPQAAAKIKETFKQANGVLDDWKRLSKLGKLQDMNQETFPAWRREVLLLIAQEIEKE